MKSYTISHYGLIKAEELKEAGKTIKEISDILNVFERTIAVLIFKEKPSTDPFEG
jgi:orotate phosphoribosyltransferase-like protein